MPKEIPKAEQLKQTQGKRVTDNRWPFLSPGPFHPPQKINMPVRTGRNVLIDSHRNPFKDALDSVIEIVYKLSHSGNFQMPRFNRCPGQIFPSFINHLVKNLQLIVDLYL